MNIEDLKLQSITDMKLCSAVLGPFSFHYIEAIHMSDSKVQDSFLKSMLEDFGGNFAVVSVFCSS